MENVPRSGARAGEPAPGDATPADRSGPSGDPVTVHDTLRLDDGPAEHDTVRLDPPGPAHDTVQLGGPDRAVGAAPRDGYDALRPEDGTPRPPWAPVRASAAPPRPHRLPPDATGAGFRPPAGAVPLRPAASRCDCPHCGGPAARPSTGPTSPVPPTSGPGPGGPPPGVRVLRPSAVPPRPPRARPGLVPVPRGPLARPGPYGPAYPLAYVYPPPAGRALVPLPRMPVQAVAFRPGPRPPLHLVRPGLLPLRPPAPRLRCADDDREKVAGLLGRHFAAGRLQLLEYEERLERAWAATYLDELPALFADLPLVRETPPPDLRSRWHVCGSRVVAAGVGVTVALLVVGVVVLLAGTAAVWAVPPAVVLGGVLSTRALRCGHRTR